jgi:hypothetical protein
LVIDVNIAKNDSRSGLEGYNTKNNVQYPSVLYGSGGSQWDAALNNQGYGNPEYWIKPDKSFVRQPTISSEIAKAGLKPHVCAPVQLTHTNAAKGPILIHSIQSGALHCTVRNAGTYSIAAFTSNGKTIFAMRSSLIAGENLVPFPKAQGVLIVSVSNGAEKAVKRVSCVR